MKRFSLIQSHIDDLKYIAPNSVYENVDLSKLSRWRIGGIADCIVQPSNTISVAELIGYMHSKEIPYVVIGSTSNLLFSDEGIRAVIIKLGDKISDFSIKGDIVWVQAGKWVPGFAKNIAQAGFSGIEHTAGIPGTIGGLICMNGGSQRKGIGSHIKSVTAVSPTGNIKKFSKDECKFDYRSSVFQENGYVITEGELKFSKRSDYKIIRDEMIRILRLRRGKFPQKSPNCGSTFISNPEMYDIHGPPGKIIENLGYKGFRIGGAMVSNLHANFIINTGDATAKNIVSLVNQIKFDVYKHTGFEMISEVKFVDELGGVTRLDLVA